jgi:hypothetical protein
VVAGDAVPLENRRDVIPKNNAAGLRLRRKHKPQTSGEQSANWQPLHFA